MLYDDVDASSCSVYVLFFSFGSGIILSTGRGSSTVPAGQIHRRSGPAAGARFYKYRQNISLGPAFFQCCYNQTMGYLPSMCCSLPMRMRSSYPHNT